MAYHTPYGPRSWHDANTSNQRDPRVSTFDGPYQMLPTASGQIDVKIKVSYVKASKKAQYLIEYVEIALIRFTF